MNLTQKEKSQLLNNAQYWKDRDTKSLNTLSNKTIKDIENELAYYYKKTMESCISDFEKTYLLVFQSLAANEEPTPAHLYNLSRYYEQEKAIAKQLTKLGRKEIELLHKKFLVNYTQIYRDLGQKSYLKFGKINTDYAEMLINSIWCADGKHWSERVWKDNLYLKKTLNDELLHCVITGKKPSYLKKVLQKRFEVSYHQANTIARTEIAHIQTEATVKRYKDNGITKYQVWASEDERRCSICGKLHEQTFDIQSKPPVPAHPNCRCCIVPIIE